ncbi:alpha/beta fold hydrolase [Sphingobium estronivorans]|uniref:alpha/beta fold hydrolase n=1 Tax=Sphingobium estronivorans TaxID=1577690 RepID=UPI001F07B123|nr:alpha/beta hydrolase [Sphingobium estronivorans]
MTHYYAAGEGRPLILIHGGGAGADAWGNWGANAIPLFARRFRTFAYDMVGFGLSSAPSPDEFQYDQDARIAQLIAFIEGLNLGPVDVVGNSMGGATALGAAMRRPELVRSAVLMGSAGLNRGLNPALGAIVNYDFTVEGMRRMIAALTHDGFMPSEEMVAYRHELSCRPDIQQAYRATMGWVKQRGGLYYEDDEIAQVKNRILVFQGKDDKVVPLTEGYKFLDLLENSSGYFLDHCGHWAMIEHPQLFARVAIDFLENA